MRPLAAVAALFLLPGCVQPFDEDPAPPAESWVYNPVNRQGVIDVPLGSIPQTPPDPSCITLNALNQTQVSQFRTLIRWTPSQDAARSLSLSVEGPAFTDARQGQAQLVIDVPPFQLGKGDEVEIRISAPEQTVPATPPASQEVSFVVSFVYSRLSHEAEQEIHRLMFGPSTDCRA